MTSEAFIVAVVDEKRCLSILFRLEGKERSRLETNLGCSAYTVR